MNESLVYNGQQINERGEMLSLTDMWRADDGEDTRRPNDWLALPASKTFVSYLEATTGKSGSELIQALNEGGTWNTWAHWQIGLAYAKYLSPEFHAWCNQVVRDHMEGKLVKTVTGQSGLVIQQEVALRVLKAELEIYSLFSVPEHIAQVEAVKTAERETGLDYSRCLTHSPAQTNVPEEDLMLEPTDMAKALGIRSGADFNKWLEAGHYQVKMAGGWEPTKAGSAYCVKHQWKTTFKTGYNLKWSKKFCLSLLPEDWRRSLSETV